MKKTLLSFIAGAVALTASAQYKLDADFSTVSNFQTNSGAYELGVDAGALTVTCAAGHGEWDNFEFNFPAETEVLTTDTIRISFKAVNASADSLQPVFDFTLVDTANTAVLNSDAQAVTRFTTTDEYVEYAFVISNFTDVWDKGTITPVDVYNTAIVRARMALNAGFAQSFAPIGNDQEQRTSAFVGVFYLNKITIGEMEVGLDDIQIVQNNKVYPNPSEGVVNLSFDALNASKVEVRNVLGAVIWSDVVAAGQYTNTVEIEQPGAYFVSVVANGVAETTKVIVK